MSFRRLPALGLILFATALAAAQEPAVRFERSDSELKILVGERPFARYVFGDPKILRPYFTELRASDGTQVTRTHPPRDGVDAADHETMHPGVWLAFGDLSGADFWRNKARVEHAGFPVAPEGGAGRGRFVARNRYVDGERLVCEEDQTITIVAGTRGVHLLIDSNFLAGERPFYFGDQEEMGLGLRVASELAVVNGGHIVSSEGARDEAGCWGKTALWAEYGGTIGGSRAGLVLMPHPGNFRPSWFHARDYGFIAANPFGRKAFTGGEESRVEVAAGASFHLRYGVYIYSLGAEKADPAAAYAEYLDLIDWPAAKDREVSANERE